MDMPHFIYMFDNGHFDGHLSCFHFLAIINNASLSIHVLIFVWTYVFILIHISRGEIAGSLGNVMFNKLKNCQTCPKWLPHFTLPPIMYEDSQSLHILANLVIVCLFYYRHPRSVIYVTPKASTVNIGLIQCSLSTCFPFLWVYI